MSAYTQDEYFADTLNPNGERFPKTCFLCGEDLFNSNLRSTGGVVHWSGETHISLHQSCAEALAIHLLQDARSIVSKTGVQSKLEHSPPKTVDHLWHVKEHSPSKGEK